jgi:hypothetical protein
MWRLLLVLMFASAGFAQVTYLRIESGLIERKLRAPHDTTASRVASLGRLFQQAGCKSPMLQAQDVPGEKSRNVICTLAGEGTGKILIGAPLDYETKGDEATVQWATVAMLPLLAESLNSALHRHSFVLAAFSGKDGVAGAKAYVSSLTGDERRLIAAVISLDRIGRTPAVFTIPAEEQFKRVEILGVITSSTPRSVLTNMLELSADGLNLSRPLENPLIPRGFLSQFKPETRMVTLHSLAYTSMPRFGGTEMRMASTAVDQKEYERTYNLLSVYGLLLDQALDREKRPDSRKASK